MEILIISFVVILIFVMIKNNMKNPTNKTNKMLIRELELHNERVQIVSNLGPEKFNKALTERSVVINEMKRRGLPLDTENDDVGSIADESILNNDESFLDFITKHPDQRSSARRLINLKLNQITDSKSCIAETISMNNESLANDSSGNRLPEHVRESINREQDLSVERLKKIEREATKLINLSIKLDEVATTQSDTTS